MNPRKNARLTPQVGSWWSVGSKSKAGKLPMRHWRLACLSAAHTTGRGDCGVVDEAVAVRSNTEHEQPENGDKTKRPYD